MDFVVVGFGLGALMVLLGLGLRDLGPWFWRISPWREIAPPVLVRRVAQGRGCRAGGLVLTLAGGAILLTTILALAAGAGDRAGLLLVAGTITLAAGGALAWLLAYVRFAHPDLWSPPRRTATPVAADASAPAPEAPPPTESVRPPWLPVAPLVVDHTVDDAPVEEAPAAASVEPKDGPAEIAIESGEVIETPPDVEPEIAPAGVPPAEPAPLPAVATARDEPTPESGVVPELPAGTIDEADADVDPNPAPAEPIPIVGSGRETLVQDAAASDGAEPVVAGRLPGARH